MYHWSSFPSPDELQQRFSGVQASPWPLTNGHLHTPYSFSAFSSIEEAVKLAVENGLKVVGINDFNTVAGYPEWSRQCQVHHVAPLFNIEMIGLNPSDQEMGIRVNDPSNPGRTYLSGKGLSVSDIPSHVRDWLDNAVEQNNEQSEKMAGLLNHYLGEVEAPFRLDFENDIKKITLGQIRERHLATALRMKVDKIFTTLEEKEVFYQKLINKEISNPADAAHVENQLRSALLKLGGPAFVSEDPDHFPEVETIRKLVIDAGGVPTYPFLGDALDGRCTDFEHDLEETMTRLKERGIYSVEFITPRNSIPYLRNVVPVLWENGFLVTFGTEHNTSAMTPMVPEAKGEEEIPADLLQYNIDSVCILLAHQYLMEKENKGWQGDSGQPRYEDQEYFIRTGQNLLHYIFSGY